MKQSSKRLVSIGLALVFIIGALVFFFDLVQPAYGNISTLKGQIAGEQTLLSTEQQAVTQAQALIAQYQNPTQDEQNLALAMPNGEDLAGALAQVYGLASANGIVLQSVGISAPTLQNEAQTSGDGSTQQLIQPLGTISFQLSAAGSYEALQAFIAGLETNIRIFNITSVSISPSQSASVAGKASTAGTQDFFTYAITVQTYYQTTQLQTN